MDLELARKKVQVMKAKAAKEELKFKVMEREQDILRLLEHIEKQDKLIEELEEDLKE